LNGKRPIVFAVLEDDTEAVRLLLVAGVERQDALQALNVVAERGIERSGVRAMLETLELQDVLAGAERRGMRARVRARL
jgi:hypothetical protein